MVARPRFRLWLFALAASLMLVPGACSSNGDGADSAGGADSSGTGTGDDDDGGTGSGTATGTGGGTGSDPGAPGDDACRPPNLLIVLDRTMSMHRKPDGDPATNTPAGLAESKWAIAVTATEALASDLEGTIRFGLSLFPRDPGGDVCVTLAERIEGQTASNVDCEAGEVVVSPGPATSTDIAASIEVETTRLCTSTPIGAGLGTALEAVTALDDDRETYVLLITDGRDTCDGNLAVANAQALAAAGAPLFVVGFDGSERGIDRSQLNDMTCGGQTARDLATDCVNDGNDNFTAADPEGPALFLSASNAVELGQALEDIATEVCCDCVE